MYIKAYNTPASISTIYDLTTTNYTYNIGYNTGSIQFGTLSNNFGITGIKINVAGNFNNGLYSNMDSMSIQYQQNGVWKSGLDVSGISLSLNDLLSSDSIMDTVTKLTNGNDTLDISDYRFNDIDVNLGNGNDTFVVNAKNGNGGLVAGGYGVDTIYVKDVDWDASSYFKNTTSTNTELFDKDTGATLKINLVGGFENVKFANGIVKTKAEINTLAQSYVSKPVVTTEKHIVDIVVDKGVLAQGAVFLDDIDQTIIKTNGVITENFYTYGGARFNHADVDAIISIAQIDNKWSPELTAELQNLTPFQAAHANVLAQQLKVGLIGVADYSIAVMGLDGNYVG